MSVERFNQLKQRLDAVQAGTPPALGMLDRARRFFGKGDVQASFETLRALDAQLDRAGIHTTADARLLRELGAVKGTLAELKEGLTARAEQALEEFEAALAEAERLTSLEKITASQKDTLTREFQRLGRVVKVAAVFSGPVNAPAPFELLSGRRKNSPVEPPKSPQLAIAEFLTQRALAEVLNTAKKRRDLDLAYELLLRMAAETKGDRHF